MAWFTEGQDQHYDRDGRGQGLSKERTQARALALEVSACVEDVGGERHLEGALHLPGERVIDVPLLQQG